MIDHLVLTTARAPSATGPIRSVYVRDPDFKLIEISEPA